MLGRPEIKSIFFNIFITFLYLFLLKRLFSFTNIVTHQAFLCLDVLTIITNDMFISRVYENLRRRNDSHGCTFHFITRAWAYFLLGLITFIQLIIRHIITATIVWFIFSVICVVDVLIKSLNYTTFKLLDWLLNQNYVAYILYQLQAHACFLTNQII